MSARSVQLKPDAPAIPAEFRGLARAFLKRVEIAAAAAKEIQNETVSYCRRLIHGPRRITYRDEDFAAIETQWRSLPTPAVLIPLVVTRVGQKLSMMTTQISTAETSKAAWGEDADELNLMVDRHVLDTGKRKMDYNSLPQVAISLHALARWYMRTGGARGDAEIRSDIVGLVTHKITAVPPLPLEIAVPVPGGSWLGQFGAMRVMSGKEFVVLSIRTFL